MRAAPSHRVGSGPPLVLLHGFVDTWRTWELVLPALARHHDVLAPTLAGHAGGPALPPELGPDLLADAVGQAMDDAGFALAHIVGNSLGGYVALQLAARGRAKTVVAFAPAGGAAQGDDSYKELLALQRELVQQTRVIAPYADAIVSTPEGRRRATELITTNYERIPPELLAHQLRGVADAPDALRMIEYGLQNGFPLHAEKITCPVRIVWGTEDKLLPWPRAAGRYRTEWLPHADWVELEGVGHCPQLDVPLEAGQLILGFTSEGARARTPRPR
jgi:pimeloyl-ACP methyl ester carboxylesterase